MSVRPFTARSRTTTSGSTPGAPSTEPHRATTDSRLVPRPPPVIPVDKATVRCHLQPGPIGDRLRCLPRPAQRAGDDGGEPAGAQHRPEPPGLMMPDVVERRVEQAAQDAGLIQRRLAVPHQVDQDTAVRGSHQRTAYSSRHRLSCLTGTPLRYRQSDGAFHFIDNWAIF
jgi:hypothetical protein